MTDAGKAAKRIASVVMILLFTLFDADVAQTASLQEEQQCLALSIYWEARGEGRRGMVAVGWTILNRVNSPEFPATPCGVMRQGGERPPCQFSWWCDGKSDRPRDRHSWHMAMVIAAGLLLDPPPDPTHGSLFYHSTQVLPGWSRSRKKKAGIGAHVFYR